MPDWTRVAAAVDCPPGRLKGVMAAGTPVVLANVDGTIYALRDECSHEEYPLSDGEIEDDQLVCIYHGARFDIATGMNRALPAVRPVRSFPVEVRDGDVYVDVG